MITMEQFIGQTWHSKYQYEIFQKHAVELEKQVSKGPI